MTSARVPKIFVVCDQKDTAPIWGYILRQTGLNVVLETALEKALEHWFVEIPDLIILDINISSPECARLYRSIREQSIAPLLLLLPAYHETQMLEAYAIGVDDVVVKPISPPVFLAKIMAWVRRSWTVPVSSLSLINTGSYSLEPSRRCLVQPNGQEVKLTNLEFHLLHVLMNHPGRVLSAEELIQSIWGGYGDGDQVLLKNVVYRLRKKIEVDPGHPVLLQTWKGGYCFQA